MTANRISFLVLGIILLIASCRSNEFLTDASLIDAIQSTTYKTSISVNELPADAVDLLKSEYAESNREYTRLAPELGYEVILRRKVGALMGEQNSVYFNLEGRRLLREDRLPDLGEDGTDRGECFDLVYPITLQMPANVTLTGSDEIDLWTKVRNWYVENPSIDESPQLVYPVEVILQSDGSLKTVENEEAIAGLGLGC